MLGACRQVQIELLTIRLEAICEARVRLIWADRLRDHNRCGIEYCHFYVAHPSLLVVLHFHDLGYSMSAISR